MTKTKIKKVKKLKRTHHALKLQHHAHSGKVLPHQHTSYRSLWLIFFVSFLSSLMTITLIAFSAHANTVIQSSGINVSATVPGPAPATAPAFTSPENGQKYSDIPIELKGTCIPDLLVKITRNNVVAGSVFCTSSGIFSIWIDLVTGKNTIKAVQYDLLDQASPDSLDLELYYNPIDVITGQVTSETPTVAIDRPVLSSDYSFRGVQQGETVHWEITITGGAVPYALAVSINDQKPTLYSFDTAGTKDIKLKFDKPGQYAIINHLTDVKDEKARLDLAVLVNGTSNYPSIIGPVSGGSDDGKLYAKIMKVIPFYAVTASLIGSFWLGQVFAKGVPNIRLKHLR